MVSLGSICLPYKMRGMDTTISKGMSSSKAHPNLTHEGRELSTKCCGLVGIHTPERPVNEKSGEGERWRKGV